ncbi:type I restriction endonuclease subunit R [Bifidobacterium asteroides]|uniref:Type I restriction enzyme endonuclease subunit n=1 Tax=Bifidobacterium asteroides TaxID=1684 RepID=A0A318M027_9BIFI|nr:type I restriction endonuclease subunit R [Bifidobacterium asteroides]PXY81578.1 DEAD/DEAH box helicase [Bifidobacterium asteroides]
MNSKATFTFKPAALPPESTVIAQYDAPTSLQTEYQSEADLECEFIKLLESQAYEYVAIHTEQDLIENLRSKLEELNNIAFTDREWDRFFSTSIASNNDGIAEKTFRIQKDHIQILRRDDGSTKNIKLIDKENIHNNALQVINQYYMPRSQVSEHTTHRFNRYDVTILVNGLPLVHVELKRRGVNLRKAFNQIDRYQQETFWASSGLFEYVQLFVISNGTFTKYYSNSTRQLHIAQIQNQREKLRRQSLHGYEFTNWWADATNKRILDLHSFTRTFFAKHTILNILTRYCVLTVDGTLMVMRPYQIVATERILQRIVVSTNAHKLGTIKAGGYIWHATGSGKTLTSFKTAQLATQIEGVEKVLFVVDRKDLDYQTMREYDSFEKGAANSNTSTKILKRQLKDPSVQIIITTIQKLSNFIENNSHQQVYQRHVVIIFDECHRSQFGYMHKRITSSFKKYNIFGFTGTPIFAANSRSGNNSQLKTTEQVFGDRLHTYTIVDAIRDKNVLPFRIDYLNSVEVGHVTDDKVSGIDTERALLDNRRIYQIVKYTLEHFAQKTRRQDSYQHTTVTNVTEVVKSPRGTDEIKRPRRVKGFNALFATASIEAAKRYYIEFQHQQADLAPDQRLKIGMIYSYSPNIAQSDGLLDDEDFTTDYLDNEDRDFLEDVIADYNDMFHTSYDTSADKFQNYYKDLSMRLKNREIDMVIVVNMFLTGFDATTLNTLFVDKDLRMHGLIQAFSRTNRILNSIKTYGNIVSFRNLEQQTNEALELYGNKDVQGTVVLKPYRYYYDQYQAKVKQLRESYPIGRQITGEKAQRHFIMLFGNILRLKNILDSFDEFSGHEILSAIQYQDYQSMYLDMYADYRNSKRADKESINDDLNFEIELVKQVEINVDYILMLVDKYHKAHGNGADEELRTTITKAVNASPTLRDKRDLIERFVDTVSITGTVEEQWQRFISKQQQKELTSIINEEHLKPESTERFMRQAFENGDLQTGGTAITQIMPPISRFTPTGGYQEQKQRVIDKLVSFFDRFVDLGQN